MKILECEQGSAEWHEARLGIPTASKFSMLITSAGKKSTQTEAYLNFLVAESLMGKAADGYQSMSMKRGKEVEPLARAWYEFQTGKVVEQVGFVLRDDWSVGASPDGLVENSGLEIKCPEAKTHVEYLRKNKIPTAYVAQVQGCMWICERESWDFLSYHPDMSSMIITVQRDSRFIASLAKFVDELVYEKSEILEKLRRDQCQQ